MVWREDAWEYPLHGLRRCGVDVLLALPCWPLFVCLYWVRYDWICHVGGMLSVVGEAPSLVVTSGTCLVVLSYPLCLLSLPGLCTPGCPADSAFISTFVVLAPVGGSWFTHLLQDQTIHVDNVRNWLESCYGHMQPLRVKLPALLTLKCFYMPWLHSVNRDSRVVMEQEEKKSLLGREWIFLFDCQDSCVPSSQ